MKMTNRPNPIDQLMWVSLRTLHTIKALSYIISGTQCDSGSKLKLLHAAIPVYSVDNPRHYIAIWSWKTICMMWYTRWRQRCI